MGSKQIRKNFFKNSVAKKHAKIIHSFKVGLKIATAITALLLISFVAIFGYDFLTQCAYFKAQKLIVTGTERLAATHVLKHAQIKKGTNILSLNLATARKRLLAHSWIAEAEVSRELPSNIHIRIKEHKPIAVIDLGRKFLINTQGEIFKEVSASDQDNLPIISGLEFSDINVKDESRSLPFDAVMDILHLGQKPNSVIPNSLIKKIKVDREIGLTIYAPYFESGLINSYGSSRASDFIDYDNDGDLDLYITRVTYYEQPDMDICQLWRNDDGYFREVPSARVVHRAIRGMGWADYDNDGDPDLHLLEEGGDECGHHRRGDPPYRTPHAAR